MSEIDTSRETLPCGHHKSLAVMRAETGEFLYCELCDERDARRDAEKMEREYKAERDRLRAENAALKADAEYRLWKLQQCIPVMQEARDALCALTVSQLKLHQISPSLAQRMDYAGTADVPEWQAAVAASHPEQP